MFLRFAFAIVLAGPMGAIAHEPVEWNGATYRVVLSSTESDGKSGMFTVAVKQPGGPPLHVHADADEYFYVLEGTVRFRVDERSDVLRTGEVAYVPRGTEHTYRVESEEGGRMLTIVVPGGFERFFEAMAAEALVIPDDMPRIGEIAERFELTFTGPPLPPK
ncbi:MAG: cupin domain-containing protein [Candidatus Wenzhouxiangella sp. M2_3B_020]